MRNNSLMMNNSLLASKEAELGALRLIERIKSDSLNKEILPNTYEVYTGEIEEENYRSFCSFLKSRNGRMVIDMVKKEEGIGNGNSRE